MAIIKNMAKDGRYYWVITDFVTQVNAEREIIDYTAYRRPVCDDVIDAITPLYDALLAIERFSGMEDAEAFLNHYFKKNSTDYDDFIEELMIENCKKKEMETLRKLKSDKSLTKKEKRSFFEKLFGIK